MPVTVPIACLLALCWAVSAPRERRIVIEEARLPSGVTTDLLIVDGIIAAIGDVETIAGDVVVRARGGEVIAGRRRTLATTPDWSDLVEGPALGWTSVVLPSDAVDRAWLDGIRSRAAWVGPRIATAGESGSHPRVSPGFPAELLVLDPDSRTLSQAVVGDQVLRRADLETRREMLATARRRLAALPPPGPGLRGLRIDAVGLPVGRLDLRPDGRLVHERIVAPHAIERTWEIRPEPEGWSVVLRENGTEVATVRGDSSGVRAQSTDGRRIDLPGLHGEPSIDLAATAAWASSSLMSLPPGGMLELPMVQLEVGPGGLTVRPDRRRFVRRRPSEVPFPMVGEERAVAVISSHGPDALVVLGPDGFPVRGWETGTVGDIEWVGRPLDPPGTGAGTADLPPPATELP